MAVKLGKLLIHHKLVTPEQVNKALEAQRLYGGKLGTNLVELGFISDLELAEFLGKQFGIPAATASDFEDIPQKILDLVPNDFASEHRVVPLRLDQKLHVAISDPNDLSTLDQLGFQTGKAIHPVIAPEIWIVAALERCYGVRREVRYISVSQDAEGLELTHSLSVMPLEPHEEEPEYVEPIIPLQSYTTRLLKTEKPDQVFQAALDFLHPFFSQMAVFVVRRDQLCGAIVRGFPVHTAAFLKIAVPVVANHVGSRVVKSGKDYRGAIPATDENQELFGHLAIPQEKEVGIYPLPFDGKTMAILLGVPQKEYGPPRPEAGRIVPEVLAKAGLALEIILRRRKLSRASTTVSRGT